MIPGSLTLIPAILASTAALAQFQGPLVGGFGPIGGGFGPLGGVPGFGQTRKLVAQEFQGVDCKYKLFVDESEIPLARGQGFFGAGYILPSDITWHNVHPARPASFTTDPAFPHVDTGTRGIWDDQDHLSYIANLGLQYPFEHLPGYKGLCDVTKVLQEAARYPQNFPRRISELNPTNVEVTLKEVLGIRITGDDHGKPVKWSYSTSHSSEHRISKHSPLIAIFLLSKADSARIAREPYISARPVMDATLYYTDPQGEVRMTGNLGSVSNKLGAHPIALKSGLEKIAVREFEKAVSTVLEDEFLRGNARTTMSVDYSNGVAAASYPRWANILAHDLTNDTLKLMGRFPGVPEDRISFPRAFGAFNEATRMRTGFEFIKGSWTDEQPIAPIPVREASEL